MSIQKRTVFYNIHNGIFRFWDWAQVTTTLGTMIEPFLPNNREKGDGYSEFDPTDMMSRIDCIEGADIDKQYLQLSGGTHALIGGPLNPRNNQR